MNRHVIFLPVVLLALLGCAQNTWAQAVATAQINGTVHDASGLAVPGAEVKATQTETGTVRTVVSGADGGYVLTNLAVGPYQLEIAKEGFNKFVQTGIVLQVASNPQIDVSLKVGSVSEQVQVEANAAMVETQNSGVGQVVENQQILDLPLNGRDANALIMLAGAAVQTGVTSNRSFAGLPTVSVAGGLDLGVAYFLDGAMHLDPYNGQSQPFPFPDALQEFKLETSGLSAQHSQGTSVNAVTKSGTNEFHGDAFEFVRNDLFNARNYFSTTTSTLKRNQFGGVLGGPIIKNKLFFFGGYQRTTIRQDPGNTQAFVPTAAMLAGDFTAFASPACNVGRQINLKAPFVNNAISPALFDQASVKIVAKVPVSTNPCGLITYGAPSPENDGQFITKIDDQLSAKNSLFGRYVRTSSSLTNPFSLTPNNILNTGTPGFDNIAQGFTLGDTHLVNANIVNSFRLAVLRVSVDRIGAQFFSAPDVGINTYSYLPKFMVLAITSGFNIGSATGADSSFITTTYQISDDVNMVHGAHQLSFGGNVAQPRSYSYSNNGPAGNFTFNGQFTGLGLPDFFTGQLSSFAQSGPILLNVKQTYIGLYGQDSWRVTPRLTLNYGLRWEPYLPQVFTNGAVYNFDLGRFEQGIVSTQFKNAPAGFYYPGDPGFPGKSGINKRLGDFDPRVGLAWDPQGNGRTSIRASYGMNYAYFPLQMRINSVQSPFSSSATIPSPAGGFDNPWLGVAGGNPFPLTVDKNARFSANGNFASLPYNITPTYVHSWNLAIQRQISANWLASATYLGNHDVHVWLTKPLNNAQFLGLGPCTLNGVSYTTCSTTTNTNQRRLLSLLRPQDGQYIGTLDSFDNGGTQSYHGLLLSIQRRAVRGVTLNANYTWSHCIGDYSTSFGPNVGNSYPDPNNRDLNRGNCPGDRRQVLNLTGVAETPRFANHMARMLGTGWRLAGIYTFSTGAYLAVLSGIDRSLTGVATGGVNGQRPNQVLADPYGNMSVTNYLNPAAFAQQALGTFGNMQMNNLAGPAFFELDAALSRNFRIRERQTLEFRFEAFNVPNSLRKGNPNLVLNSSTFGTITTAGDPRIMQFALKYVF